MRFVNKKVMLVMVTMVFTITCLSWYIAVPIGNKADECINVQISSIRNIGELEREEKCEVLVEGMNEFKRCYREVGDSAIIPYSTDLLELYIKLVFKLDVKEENQMRLNQLQVMCPGYVLD